MTQLTCRVCGKPRPYLPTYGLDLCWPCYLAHAGKRDRKDQESMDDVLSEAGRLATQTPYEAGYRDGFNRGREAGMATARNEPLRAAASDLLEACRVALSWGLARQPGNTSQWLAVVEQIEAAIAAAEGKAE